MKKIWNLVVVTLAANFVLVACGVGWLAKSGHLTRSRMADVRKVLFPTPVVPPAPTTRPAAVTPPDAAQRLRELGAVAAGRSRGGRLVSIDETRDLTLAGLDDRKRELVDLQQQVELARDQVARDRAAVERDRAALAADRNRDAATSVDKGFQDSLAMYRTLPPRQVKAIFATLPDDTVQRYLQAMDAKQATKVMKEFKTPADVARLQRVLERIRGTPADAAATTQPVGQPTGDPSAAVPDGR